MEQTFRGNFNLLDSQTNQKFITHLILLNSTLNTTLLQSLVNHSQKIILADGGANIFYNTIKNHQIIQCIVGDLDSIEQNVLEYYKKLGVKIFQMKDQDSTDLQKAISKIQLDQKYNLVCIVGGSGDRIDHNIGVYSILARTGRSLNNSEVFLINNCGIMFYLKPNKQYKIKSSKYQSKSGCGVITFNQVKKITTKGLKWDMGKQYQVCGLEFGGMLSTSNQKVAQEIQILASDEAFWISNIVLKN